MFGFEFILNTFESNPNQLSEELGIRRQSVYEWIKKKKVPNSRLKQLSEMFLVPEEYFNKELTQSEMLEIETKYKNEKIIQVLEEKRVSVKEIFGHQELNDLVLSLYRKMIFDEKNVNTLYRKMTILKNILYLIIESDDKNDRYSILGEATDLLSQDIEGFNSDLFKLVQKYEDYL